LDGGKAASVTPTMEVALLKRRQPTPSTRSHPGLTLRVEVEQNEI